MTRFAAVSALTRLAAAVLALTFLPVRSHAQPAPAATPAGENDAPPTADDTPAPARQMPKLNYRQGKITLSDGLAELNVPENFRFLDAADARKVVVDVWGNPPEVARSVIGMLLPAGVEPNEERSWGVVISYENEGYVKDDDASKLDYGKMLTTMQQATHEANEARVKEGYPAMELVGWAEPPQYDAAQKKMYWAKELKIGNGEDAHAQLRHAASSAGRACSCCGPSPAWTSWARSRTPGHRF